MPKYMQFPCRMSQAELDIIYQAYTNNTGVVLELTPATITDMRYSVGGQYDSKLHNICLRLTPSQHKTVYETTLGKKNRNITFTADEVERIHYATSVMKSTGDYVKHINSKATREANLVRPAYTLERRD